ncbi:hypothetical protein FNJ84_06410 [Paracoccus sp. M683]|uniref:hypothetical protein n=1 Tax=Paracoccus sp. M683 TaxID=2594268 RepID=UPI00117F89A7|nr:hypothetical protein [Paracoccus sp. M683]TRW98404.1 hypothetical protein FNJ84_06410 [Paracoccus sp. M683]
MRLILALVLLLTTMLVPVAARAQDRPPAGLMWNRSGLPATLPLQIRSPPGRDLVVFLTRPGSADPLVAGFVRGGDFFRLLVPPGEWQIDLATGETWQDESALFGPDTNVNRLSQPLIFSITGGNRRNGHVITLIEDAGKTAISGLAPQVICQIADWNGENREYRPAGDTADIQAPPLAAVPATPEVPRRAWRYLHRTLKTRSIFCD